MGTFMLNLSIYGFEKTKRVRLAVAIRSYERVDVKCAELRSEAAACNATR
jgi:hypothetical protein